MLEHFLSGHLGGYVELCGLLVRGTGAGPQRGPPLDRHTGGAPVHAAAAAAKSIASPHFPMAAVVGVLLVLVGVLGAVQGADAADARVEDLGEGESDVEGVRQIA